MTEACVFCLDGVVLMFVAVLFLFVNYVVCSKQCADSDTFSLEERFSSFVDTYNATSNSWTRLPEGLGQPRSALVSASLPSGLVFFAGGITLGARQSLFACHLPRVLFFSCTLSIVYNLFCSRCC